MERKHAIIIIKNEKNKYLQYYDNRWESYLFPNCKINDKTDYDKIKENIYILLPKKYRRRLKRLFKDINKDLFSFIKGTLILTIIVFVISLILFSCFKLKAPIFFALFNSVMNIIPYIGPIIGGVPIVIIAFTQSNEIGIFILQKA